jgi:hypothetical protein
MKKESLNIPKPGGSSGPKYTAAAKGGSLPEGTSHMEKVGSKIDSMYGRGEPESKQRPAKGSDRI